MLEVRPPLQLYKHFALLYDAAGGGEELAQMML